MIRPEPCLDPAIVKRPRSKIDAMPVEGFDQRVVDYLAAEERACSLFAAEIGALNGFAVKQMEIPGDDSFEHLPVERR